MRNIVVVLAFMALTACVQNPAGNTVVGGIGDGVVSEQEMELLEKAADFLIEQKKKKEAEVKEPVVMPVPPDVAKPDPVVVVPPVKEEPTLRKEVIQIHGRYNGDRPTFYGSRNLSQYPASFYFTAPGCMKRTRITTNGSRLEYGGYTNWIFKQSDVSYRGMGIVGPKACKGTEVILEF